MFGEGAPLWAFLRRFGGGADPRSPITATSVFETYPVLTMIALGWLCRGERPGGRLPKYNPARRRTFSLEDGQFVCGKLAEELRRRGLTCLLAWVNQGASKTKPRQVDQDGLDACLCLLMALYISEGRECLMVGDTETGYILVPHGDGLRRELEDRCLAIGRDSRDVVHVFEPLMSD